MKKFLIIMLALVAASLNETQAQAPNAINYQGVARNSFGTVINNRTIAIRLSVRDGGAAGPVVYSESHSISTDQYGVFSLTIGGGTIISGTMAGVNWAAGTKFLQVEMDANGGGTFTNMGTQQLVSVPFSIIAGGAPPIGPAGGDLTGTYPNPLLRLPNSKSALDAGTLLTITNTGAGVSGAIMGITQSNAANAWGLHGRVDNTGPGGFSTGVLGTNLGTGGLGIGVTGSQNGSGWGVYGTTPSGIGVNGITNSGIGVSGTSASGTGGRFSTTSGLALHTTGGVRLQGIGEAANRILTSDAAGNATWQAPSGVGIVTGTGTLNFVPKWTPSGTNLGNSLLFDDGASVGLGTTTPTHRFTVSHGGSTGISVSSTSGFSVVDINAASGDAALRFGNNGVNQWNMRNQPGTNNLEWFEFGGGGSRMILQDGTGNLGIGQATPSYRLDVLHGGSTGARIQSSGSFSVVDIDAASGDAALRFAKAGVNQWNIRNRPADDYLEIFELGGGGSRVVIQDGTGNVGIGETTSPSYKLDVLHGGSTGIRSRSSGSFSVVDIDAASGDAALRFQKAGVGQWNTRNRPADDYYEIFELGGGGSRLVIQDGTGNVGIGETTSPSYKLDVLHGGSTGIRNRSTSSFSVFDIDAFSGDAAIRFANNGVNQWNIRNQPGTDNLQIFELGGGGERMHIQNATGNVSIGGEASPAYRLDVLHGGATGARIRSSSSFSVVDIDAESGDAALRFVNAGVNQWNIRNQPGTDNLQIFELGGGGERMHIQNATGNVSIGGEASPTYRLDVLHGGATGARIRSSATFSVVDIDANSGDAALRFVKAGVNQWNTRNNPGTDDYQIFELGGGGERMRIENTTGRVVINGDLTVLGAKAFTMDHPLDPANKLLRHAAAESNEVINFYSGNVVTDAAGKATVQLPDYYQALNKDSRYQLTVIGSFAQAIISKEVSNNQFEIATNQPNVKVSWEVKGVRNDNHMKQNPFVSVEEKSAAQKGTYWDPKAHNQPMTKHVSYNPADEKSSLNHVPAADKKTAPATTGGSLEQGPIVPPAAKQADTKGSVGDMPKATEKAAPATKGGSLDEMPKPAEKVTPAEKGGSTEELPKPTEKTAPASTGGSVGETKQD